MTIKQAREKLSEVGITLSKRSGEFRVNLVGGTESTAYYTDGIDDAVGTGLYMANGMGVTE